MMKVVNKAALVCKLVGYVLGAYVAFFSRNTKPRRLATDATEADPEKPKRNIVIVGAGFAGYYAARIISCDLPADSPFEVVVIEPNSHFNFTWGKVATISRDSVTLAGSGNVIPYEYLVKGVKLLQAMQQRIKASNKLVIVGGGAAGVEVATDAKSLYPNKTVTLVHSRSAVMHRFGTGLQTAGLKGLQDLGIEVILGDRLIAEDEAAGLATLKSGKTVEYDCIVHCTGQRPSSAIVSSIAKDVITEDGYVRTRPTLQIADDSLPNVFVCGDLAGHGEANPNARSAMRKAMICADNIVLATQGKALKHTYEPYWADAVIKLTLGMDRSVTHFGDGKTELAFYSKEKTLL
ncbi:unnamed protein product [Parascedosporium putredinis]|uniref:FAD/NAD(P)-binding domain-containing protein n=1 Tax=Parascedosporium putredinis TaxID=1442378 RepID=A0A9P1M7X0_9PEZI|nr:unnamed protein product [Parascedosporium putredinis]CAI7989035.1 unnamed protein product [Parascedosporium putredinis]